VLQVFATQNADESRDFEKQSYFRQIQMCWDAMPRFDKETPGIRFSEIIRFGIDEYDESPSNFFIHHLYVSTIKY